MRKPGTQHLNEADYAKRQSERKRLEALFSDHFNDAIGKAATPSGGPAVIGDQAAAEFHRDPAFDHPQGLSRNGGRPRDPGSVHSRGAIAT